MALNTVSSDRLATNVKNTNFTAAEKQDLTNDILPLATQFGQSKNLIINGSVQVSQRGTASTSPGYLVDRYKLLTNGCDDAPEQRQASLGSGDTGPYAEGFRKAYKITNGNQTSGAGAGDYIFFRQQLEAQDIANSGWDYTNTSSFITLSFWVKSSVAQNFYGYVRTHDGTSYIYPFETGSLTADTWTKVTKTIPGNSNLQFDNDNNVGLGVNFAPFQGTDRTDAGVTLNAWAAYASGTIAPNYTSTWFTTNNATFEMTGLQLEVGSVATAFEHRSFDVERDLCRRYFQRFNFTAANTCLGSGYIESSTEFRIPFQFFKEMRDAPTFAVSSAAAFDAANGNQSRTASNIAISNATAMGCILIATTGSGLNTSINGGIFRNTSAPQHFDFSSEL